MSHCYLNALKKLWDTSEGHYEEEEFKPRCPLESTAEFEAERMWHETSHGQAKNCFGSCKLNDSQSLHRAGKV